MSTEQTTTTTTRYIHMDQAQVQRELGGQIAAYLWSVGVFSNPSVQARLTPVEYKHLSDGWHDGAIDSIIAREMS